MKLREKLGRATQMIQEMKQEKWAQRANERAVQLQNEFMGTSDGKQEVVGSSSNGSGQPVMIDNVERFQRLIVIDAPNVAMCLSSGKEFSCGAVRQSVEYFLRRNFRVIAFMPRYWVSSKRFPEKIAQDKHLIEDLIEEGFVSITPAQDYEDLYIIQVRMIVVDFWLYVPVHLTIPFLVVFLKLCTVCEELRWRDY